MQKSWFVLFVPLLLSGCIGAFVAGNARYADVPYPDIRTVPPRPKTNRRKAAADEARVEALQEKWEHVEAQREQALESL